MKIATANIIISRSFVTFVRRSFVSYVYLVRLSRSSRSFIVCSPRSFTSFVCLVRSSFVRLVRSPRSFVSFVRRLFASFVHLVCSSRSFVRRVSFVRPFVSLVLVLVWTYVSAALYICVTEKNRISTVVLSEDSEGKCHKIL